jgi:aspartate racemase
MTTDPFLGVLGGMGPAATADFLLRLARFTPAARDQDHQPVIVYSDPRTPDRSDAILGRGPSPLPAMLRGIDFLNGAGCALIAIPCNTAHYWYDELAARSAVPLLHIADTAADRLRRQGDLATVGVMATHGTIRAGIYDRRLAEAGIAAVNLADLADDDPAMRGIRLMKAGDDAAARAALHAAGHELVRRGAQALLIGCTDISATLAGLTSLDGTPVIDAADCLARACQSKLATGHTVT